MKHLTALALVICLSAPAVAKETKVKLEQKTDTIEVTVGGTPFATYNFGKNYPKPFFSPVRSADGTIITRGLKDPEDHKHHKGVWVSVDEVNENKHWAEKSRIENAQIKILKAQGDPAEMVVTNNWLGEDGKTVMVETTKISIFANRLMSYDIRFTATSGDVTFRDTKEGLFGIRFANSLREREGGHVKNAEGLEGSKACWGKVSAWVDYYGPVEGGVHGAALFDHPLNFRRSRYHVRNYGLFSISPFGPKAYTNGRRPADPKTVLKGKTLRMRYGIYVHPGDTDAAGVGEVYRDYLKVAGDS